MKKGFTMLFAVLVSSILLSIGIAILDLTLKQFILSSAGRESQVAFYAADDGMECALYWDHTNADGINKTSFASSTESIPSGVYTPQINCNGAVVTLMSVSPFNPPVGGGISGTLWASLFQVMYTSGNNRNPCALVYVTKHSYYDTSGNIVTDTTVTSRGYNTCDTTNPKRSERAIQANY